MRLIGAELFRVHPVASNSLSRGCLSGGVCTSAERAQLAGSSGGLILPQPEVRSTLPLELQEKTNKPLTGTTSERLLYLSTAAFTPSAPTSDTSKKMTLLLSTDTFCCPPLSNVTRGCSDIASASAGCFPRVLVCSFTLCGGRGSKIGQERPRKTRIEDRTTAVKMYSDARNVAAARGKGARDQPPNDE